MKHYFSCVPLPLISCILIQFSPVFISLRHSLWPIVWEDCLRRYYLTPKWFEIFLLFLFYCLISSFIILYSENILWMICIFHNFLFVLWLRIYVGECSICTGNDIGIHSFCDHPWPWLRPGQWSITIAVLLVFSILFFVRFLHKHLRLSPVLGWTQCLIHKSMVSLLHISFSQQSSSYSLLHRGPPAGPLAKKWVLV